MSPVIWSKIVLYVIDGAGVAGGEPWHYTWSPLFMPPAPSNGPPSWPIRAQGGALSHFYTECWQAAWLAELTPLVEEKLKKLITFNNR